MNNTARPKEEDNGQVCVFNWGSSGGDCADSGPHQGLDCGALLSPRISMWANRIGAYKSGIQTASDAFNSFAPKELAA